MIHKLSTLPYDIDGLEPYISKETIEYHYGKHHIGYVNKLNEIIKNTEFEDKDLKDIITSAPAGTIFNNAAQIFNHDFYWFSMSINSKYISDFVRDYINKYFESLDNFYQLFLHKSMLLFGSGWVWLVAIKKDNNIILDITSTSNAKNPLTENQIPLLVCDLWEHAYYIDYRNDKTKYVENFLKIINWEFVEENLKNILNQD